MKGAGVGSPLKPQPWAFWGENRRMSYSSSRAAGAVQVERSQLALLPHAKLPRAASALPLQLTAWEVATIKKSKIKSDFDPFVQRQSALELTCRTNQRPGTKL